MTTVKSFVSQTDAAVALSRLEAAGIEGFLADDISRAVVGAGTPGVPLRLQVADEDAERAAQILGAGEEAMPLSNDSVLPEQVTETGLTKLAAKSAMAAFVEGGIWGLVVLGLIGVAVVVCCGKVEGDWGEVLFVFVAGGLCGLILRSAMKAFRKDGNQ